MSQIPEPEQTPNGPAFEGRLLARPDDEAVDQGAGFDLTTLATRRNVLRFLGLSAGAMALAACTPNSTSSSTTPTSTAGSASGEIPEETNGPYPADGTSDVNILEQSGIVRSDITSSLDGGTTAEGVPLTFTFTITDLANDNAPYESVAVYIWQCDAQGRYSMYSAGVENETYLRGVQIADAKGQVTFKTIVPACYSGRWPHIHFEVYPDADSATEVANAIATSQVAFAEDMLNDVYALEIYAGSAQNLAQVSLETDNVFSDGVELQLGEFSGNVKRGYTGSLAVAIDATTTPAPGGGGPGDGGPGPGGPN